MLYYFVKIVLKYYDRAVCCNTNHVLMFVFSGEHLRICPQGFTCCTRDMEHRLSTESRQEFDKIMADKIGLLRNIFVSRTAKFDGRSIAYSFIACTI